MKTSKRDFLKGGLAALGSVTLASGLRPTPASGQAGDYGSYLNETPTEAAKKAADWAVTEDNILGPFHRKGAPYRAKVTPPLAEGEVLLIRGRVLGVDTRKPLANAVVDIWQANHEGRYDNDDPANQPEADEFSYRARMITDENGFYEYETIMPGHYQIGRNVWRPAHIHYWVEHVKYEKLVTQLYFQGDKFNKRDQFIKKSLIIDLKTIKTKAGNYRQGNFDIVLAPRSS